MQEENSREGSCNLGVLWLRVPPLNSVGEGCSITWFFSDAWIPKRTGLRDVLTSDFGRQHAPLKKWKQSLTVMCCSLAEQAAFAVQGALTWKSLMSLAMNIVAYVAWPYFYTCFAFWLFDWIDCNFDCRHGWFHALNSDVVALLYLTNLLLNYSDESSSMKFLIESSLILLYHSV